MIQPSFFSWGTNIKSNRISLCTPDDFNRIMDDKRTVEICTALHEAARQFDAGEITAEAFEHIKTHWKPQSIYFCYNGYSDSGQRKASEMKYSGLYRFDIDHLPTMASAGELYEAKIKPVLEEEHILAAFETLSHHGLGLVAPVHEGMTIEQSMQRLAGIIGTDYDHAVFDVSRASFAVSRNMYFYLSDHLFDDNRRFTAHLAGSTSVAGASVPKTLTGAVSATANTTASTTTENAGDARNVTVSPVPSPIREDLSDLEPLQWKGHDVTYADFLRQYWKQNRLPTRGVRNSGLYDFAKLLRPVTDNDPTLIFRLLPDVGLDEEELKGIVESVCKRKAHVVQKVVKQALDACVEAEERARIAAEGGEESEEEVPPYLAVPEFPRKLPALIQLLLSNTPKVYWKAVASGLFASLACYLKGASFRYADGKDYEATFYSILVAAQSRGKDCMKSVIDQITKRIEARDVTAQAELRAWEERCETLPANAAKPPRPKTFLQILPSADATKAAICEILAKSAPARLYCYLGEIEELDELLKGDGNRKSQFTFLKIGFDPHNRWGQSRFSSQSKTASVTIRLNLNMATTPERLLMYFKSCLLDGTLTRLHFSTIDDLPVAGDIPFYPPYDDDFQTRLCPYLDNLEAVQGVIECPEAIAFVKKLLTENQQIMLTTLNPAFEQFAHRATLIVFLKACVLWAANGRKWDPLFEPFLRWSLREDLRLKMTLFGDAIEAAQKNPTLLTPHRGPANKLLALPDTFTVVDVKALCLRERLSTPASAIIRGWKHRKLIKATAEKGTYIKLKYRQDGKIRR